MGCLMPEISTEEIVYQCAWLCEESQRGGANGVMLKIEMKASASPETMFEKWIKTKKYFLTVMYELLKVFRLEDYQKARRYSLTTTIGRRHQWDGIQMGIEFRKREGIVTTDIRELWSWVDYSIFNF